MIFRANESIIKDIRRRLIEAKKTGEGSVRKLAKRFKVGSVTVQRLFRHEKEYNNIEPKPHAGGTPFKIPVEELLTSAQKTN